MSRGHRERNQVGSKLHKAAYAFLPNHMDTASTPPGLPTCFHGPESSPHARSAPELNIAALEVGLKVELVTVSSPATMYPLRHVRSEDFVYLVCFANICNGRVIRYKQKLISTCGLGPFQLFCGYAASLRKSPKK